MADGTACEALMVRVLQEMLRLTVPLVMTTVRMLQGIVLGVGPRMGGRRVFWAWALATPARGPGGRCWLVGSLVLAVLVASDVGAAPHQSWRSVPLVMLMVMLVQVMGLLMPTARTLQVMYRVMPRVRVL